MTGRTNEMRGTTMRTTWSAALILMTLAFGSAVARAQSTTYVVGPGDVLQIMIYAAGERRDDYTVPVSPVGAITVPLIGDLRVAGLTTPDIARRMKTVLGRDYYVNPQVLVLVREFGGRVYMLGEVRRPGIYPMGESVTLMTVVETAGGLTDFAAPRHVKLTRMQNGRPIRVDIDLVRIRQGRAPDVPLQNGDRIEVGQRWF
jgi:polysaccharide export outer membrane protein